MNSNPISSRLTFIPLILLITLLIGCDNDSSSEDVDSYKLEDYYHLAESGKWDYFIYQDTQFTYYESFKMLGGSYTEGKNALRCNITRLQADSSLEYSADVLYAVEDDSLFVLQSYAPDQWVWELIPHVSSWNNKAIGDTVVWSPPIANSLTYTYSCVWTEENAQIEVNGVTYSDCRVYESEGINDFSGNTCEIIEYYAKDYGLVYKKNIEHRMISGERRILTTETKFINIETEE